MQIDKALISKLEKLAHLQMTEEEELRLQKDLQAILDMVEKMNQLDTTGVEPLRHITEAVNRFRKDAATQRLSQDDALANAPDRKGSYFKVPKVIDLDNAKS